jgi:hypothetical protein
MIMPMEQSTDSDEAMGTVQVVIDAMLTATVVVAMSETRTSSSKTHQTPMHAKVVGIGRVELEPVVCINCENTGNDTTSSNSTLMTSLASSLEMPQPMAMSMTGSLDGEVALDIVQLPRRCLDSDMM